MLDVLQNLEPRCEEGGTVLLDELDENLEINFVTKGIVYAGYQLNKQRFNCLRFQDNCIIGSFGVTFGIRSTIIYTARTKIEGYFVRRNTWLRILEDVNNTDLKVNIKQTVFKEYVLNIRSKID
tara:strand:+ start:96 stop:467 length:372 start_codon:yes stop_codon:yes gene_type:complete